MGRVLFIAKFEGSEQLGSHSDTQFKPKKAKMQLSPAEDQRRSRAHIQRRNDFDPAKIPAPDFAGEAYAFVRVALIADANTPEVTTNELATQRLKEQWEAHIGSLKAQYQAQLQEAEALREQNSREAAEAEKLAEAERQEKEKEFSKEAEKKRLPIYSFQKGLGVDSIPLQLHPYAKKMMAARKYVPLWYFLPDAATEAKERSKESLDTNHLQFAVEDSGSLAGSTISLVGSHSVRASPNAIPDSHLSWPQVMRAKSAFLNALQLGTWPDTFIAMFAGFYSNMDMHRELQEQDGDRKCVWHGTTQWKERIHSTSQ
ncbi:hypothetical protein EV359DRAFT_60614 [Lentinula novae-zelandiae]|nr:hypothetical protein EV359DRAFT_60614 [Lentinula novae-zelandiae]